MAPGRSRDHLCGWPLIFKKEFFDLCFIGSVGFGDHLTNLLLATTLFASAGVAGCIIFRIGHEKIPMLCAGESPFGILPFDFLFIGAFNWFAILVIGHGVITPY